MDIIREVGVFALHLILVIVLAIALVFSIEWFTRKALQAVVQIDLQPSTGSGHSTLIVYLPGILAGAKSSSEGQSDQWLKRADVLFVEYSGDRFNGSLVVSEVVRFLTDPANTYAQVVFIGSSMGGLLAHDIVQALPMDVSFAIDMIAIDAPTGASDFQAPLNIAARALYVMPFGKLLNPLSKRVMTALVPGPKEENIEPGVDRQKLAASVANARHYKLSFWRDQLMYIISHGAPRSYSLWQVRTFVYVRSLRDTDTVRAEAFSPWNRAVADRTTRIESDTTHVGYAERPATWRNTFQRCFAVLGM